MGAGGKVLKFRQRQSLWPQWAYILRWNKLKTQVSKHIIKVISHKKYWDISKAGYSKGLVRWHRYKESVCNTGDVGSIPGSGRSPGGGNGKPRQYSGLENDMDRGAWWASVHGVTESQTQLSNWACIVKRKTRKFAISDSQPWGDLEAIWCMLGQWWW